MRNVTNRVAESYRIISTIERVEGITTVMYGIEGVGKNQKIAISGLSDDKLRIERLVKTLNDGAFELCHFKDAVNDFLYENYGVSVK